LIGRKWQKQKEKLSPTDVHCRSEVFATVDSIDEGYVNRLNTKSIKILKYKMWAKIGMLDFFSSARTRQSTSPSRGKNRAK
jgi:hypothetical protein